MALVLARQQLGQPRARMAVILGAVAVVTAGAALLLQRKGMRRWFRGNPPP